MENITLDTIWYAIQVVETNNVISVGASWCSNIATYVVCAIFQFSNP